MKIKEVKHKIPFSPVFREKRKRIFSPNCLTDNRIIKINLLVPELFFFNFSTPCI